MEYLGGQLFQVGMLPTLNLSRLYTVLNFLGDIPEIEYYEKIFRIQMIVISD